MREPNPLAPITQPSARQFTLRTMVVLLTLVAITSAAFAWSEFAGILVYLDCLLLVLMVWRHRTVRDLIDRQHRQLTCDLPILLPSCWLASQ